MKSKKKTEEQEPLSNFQETIKTGRKDLPADVLQVNIIGAQLKDGICNYSFEIIKGIGVGATHNVKGPGIVMDSLRDAFARFNVHMAVIDDAFKAKSLEIDDIDREHVNEITGYYHVNGFKITGGAENEKITLVGNKYVSTAGGRMELKSPVIPLDNLSSYKWYNELKAAAKTARTEIELYNDGNYEPIQTEVDVTPTYKQTSLLDAAIDEKFAESEL